MHKQNTVHLFKQQDTYRCTTSFSCVGLPGFYNPHNCYSKLAQSFSEGGCPLKIAFSLWVKYTGFVWRGSPGKFAFQGLNMTLLRSLQPADMKNIPQTWQHCCCGTFSRDRGGGVMRFYWQFERIQQDFSHKLYIMFHWLNICKTDRRRHKGWLIALIYWRKKKKNITKKGHFGVCGGKRACALGLSPTCARAWQ